MNQSVKAETLGNYISLLILNQKMYTSGMISESLRNRISMEIQMDYQKKQKA